MTTPERPEIRVEASPTTASSSQSTSAQSTRNVVDTEPMMYEEQPDIPNQYVVGFVFSPDKNYVVLIIKDKPAWQKGLLNGIGGKVKEGETIQAAMQRETKEETGILIPAKNWTWVGTLHREPAENAGEFHVDIFAVAWGDWNRYEQQPNEERPITVAVRHVFTGEIPLVDNIKTLVAACLLSLSSDNAPTIHLHYHDPD